MPVPTTLRGISTTASSNSPAGSEAIGSSLDDYLRGIQSVIRQYLASKGSDMASASTVDLSTADGYFVDITGNTTITAFGTEAAGIAYLLRFTGALTLTHNGTSLILPGAANITTANGDMALMESLGSGNWQCAFYMPSETAPAEKIPTAKGDLLAASAARTLARVAVGTDGQILTAHASATAGVKWADATSITLGTEQATTSGTAWTFTSIPAGTKRITISFVNFSTNGTSDVLVQLGDSGGLESTGYTSAVQTGAGLATSTSGFCVADPVSAGTVLNGHVTLVLQDSTDFTWTATGVLMDVAQSRYNVSAGSKSLSAELDRVSVTTVSADTGDGGSVNIQYE